MWLSKALNNQTLHNLSLTYFYKCVTICMKGGANEKKENKLYEIKSNMKFRNR